MPQDDSMPRYQALEASRSLVVKVGSAVLTTAEGLNAPILENMVAQLARLQKSGRHVTLVSSGAVAAGRTALADHDISGIPGKQAAAAIGQSRLMRAYEDAFASHGLLCAQVLLTRDDLRSRQRFLNARNTFTALLGWNVIPVVNENDTVAVQELKFGDNDALASLLLNIVEGDLFINLTSTQGVLAENPLTSQVQPVPILPTISNIQNLDLDALCGGKTSVGTGGMYSKLLSARRAAQLGVPTLILPGKTPNIIDQAFNGDPVGTWIEPSHSRLISRRKYWLAYQSEPQGSVFIDPGAALALREHGKSLLPGGVHRVDGSFGPGALIRLVATLPSGDQALGVGLSNYAATDLRAIMGLKRHEVAAILGNAHYPEVIHRDNLLLDAAI